MSDNVLRLHHRKLMSFAAKLIGFTFLAALIFIWLGPIILVVITSIKANEAFLAGPFALPSDPTFAPYVTVWKALKFGPLMANSFLYATAGSALAVLLALVPAFGLSRLNVPGKALIFGVILTGLMLPQQTVLIPLYDILRTLHQLDTKIGLILVHAAYGMPAQILILRGFMSTIPREIEKAAYLEGASDFQVLRKVILPLSLPGILVGFTLNFIAIWKEFVFGLVFLNSETNFPVTVGMLKLNSDRYMAVFNLPAAGLVIAQIPIVILFLLSYRKISGGSFTGAVKG